MSVIPEVELLRIKTAGNKERKKRNEERKGRVTEKRRRGHGKAQGGSCFK